MNTLYEKTEFTTIKSQVIRQAVSDYGKATLEQRAPSTDYETVAKRLQETNEALVILNSNQHVPFMGLSRLAGLDQKIEKGMILEPSELQEYADFLRSFQPIKQLFQRNHYQTPTLFRYSQDLADFPEIIGKIGEMISGNRLRDDSSPSLRKLRGTIRKLEADIEKSMTKYLRSSETQKYLQERLIIRKDDRFTLPVKIEFQNRIKGNIVERSNRGTTVFIEPAAVSRLNEKLVLAKAGEVAEVYQILAYLTGLIAAQEDAIHYCREIIVELDVIFARGKYSRSINGQPVQLSRDDQLTLHNVRHPLLGAAAVPLNVTIGSDYRGLVITGPNAGGKTVVLKTIALTCLMTMYGLFIENSGDSQVPVFKELFIDIGDQQDLENALSTFSGHMQNTAKILAKARRRSLVLLDEIGSGTEPNEGAALGIAIMNELYQQGALVVATTHYGEIKDFALAHEDFLTAAMSFDPSTLTPRYRLLLDQVGDSNAFWIAAKMKISPQVLANAKGYLQNQVYPTEKKHFKKKALIKEVHSSTTYHKGDRVFLNELKTHGIFYRYHDDQFAEVYLKDSLVRIPLRRIQLVTSYQELYPADYDLDSLFIDFQQRKFQRDIDRGSKKAQKQLRKLASERKKTD